MKVKIAYTVEIQQVPSEVSELMTKAVEATEDAAEVSRRIKGFLTVGAIEISEARKDLDFVRRKMEFADTVFADCEAILEGYEAALIEIEKQTQLQEQKEKPQEMYDEISTR